ncbi:MAG: hypothetical protein M1829_000675 [Trizodia sp. TS-e1964]|nr:MAG: hypothetical protein M1829_000675 [Trizodia sp. TS-e1964]
MFSFLSDLLEGKKMDDKNWTSIMDTHQTEYQTLTTNTNILSLHMEHQVTQKEASELEEFRTRDVMMDRAYEALVQLVDELLKITDGGAEIGGESVPSLPVVIERFKSLAEFCESVIDKENLESVEAAQEIGEDQQIVQQLNSLKTRFLSDLEGLGEAVSRAKAYFDTNHEHHLEARSALSVAEGRQNDFLYSIFGDSDIDSALESCRQNEDMWHRKADEAWAAWDKLRQLHSNFSGMFASRLDELVQSLENKAEEVGKSYIAIGEDRKIDNECWIAARTLQYHVTATTEFISRDDALRHVIKLLGTASQLIDSDSDVARCKQRIRSTLLETLGKDGLATLEREKAYLAQPADADF